MTAKAEDRRIQRTRRLLLSALLDLIVERGYEKLAVCIPVGAVLVVPLDVVVQYTVSAFLGLLRWWMEQPAPCAAEEIDRQFRTLTIPAITAALEVGAVVA
jgi:hypothetical protein